MRLARSSNRSAPPAFGARRRPAIQRAGSRWRYPSGRAGVTAPSGAEPQQEALARVVRAATARMGGPLLFAVEIGLAGGRQEALRQLLLPPAKKLLVGSERRATGRRPVSAIWASRGAAAGSHLVLCAPRRACAATGFAGCLRSPEPPNDPPTPSALPVGGRPARPLSPRDRGGRKPPVPIAGENSPCGFLGEITARGCSGWTPLPPAAWPHAPAQPLAVATTLAAGRDGASRATGQSVSWHTSVGRVAASCSRQRDGRAERH